MDDAEALLPLLGGRSFALVVGDLLAQDVDAIVNAANGQLAHGGGVAGLIARRAGDALVKESRDYLREHGPVPTGQAVVTAAGKLPFRGVIHAVGPRQGEGHEREKLESAVAEALNRADEHGWRSVAMPAVSSGIFAVPLEVCAGAYVAGAFRHVEERPESSVEEIRLCLLDGPLVDLVRAEMERAEEGGE
jgi:O-acetyl-ADP-ribose deacetylase (regulator of RNase III)